MLTAYTPAPPPPTPVTCPSSEPGTPDCDEEVQQRQSSGSAGSADAPLHDGPLRRVTEEGPGKSSPASLSSPRAEAEMQGGDQDRSATAPLGNGISHERVQHGGQDEYSSGHMAWLAAAPGVGTQKGEASVTPGGAITPHHSETGVAPPERGAALPASARSTASAAASPGTTGTFPSYQTAVRPAQPESSSGSTCSSMSRPASANAAGQAQTSCASGCATMLQPSTSMFDAKSVSAVAAVPPLPLMSQRQHETEPPGDKSQLPCTTEMPGGPATQPARPELVPLAPSGGVWQGPMPQGPVEGSQAAMTMEAGAAVTRYPTPLLQGPAQRSGAGGMIDAGAANARSPTPDGELLLLPPSPTAISPSKAVGQYWNGRLLSHDILVWKIATKNIQCAYPLVPASPSKCTRCETQCVPLKESLYVLWPLVHGLNPWPRPVWLAQTRSTFAVAFLGDLANDRTSLGRTC